MQYLKQLNENDKQALLAIARCGHATEEKLLKLITKNRIYSYLREGLIQKETYYHEVNSFTGYRLSKKGKRFIVKKFGLTNFKFEKNQSLIHNKIICDYYFTLSQQEQRSWITEGEVKLMLEEMRDELEANKSYSALDAIYTNKEGELIGLEAVIRYSPNIRTGKVNVSELLNLKYKEIRR